MSGCCRDMSGKPMAQSHLIFAIAAETIAITARTLAPTFIKNLGAMPRFFECKPSASPACTGRVTRCPVCTFTASIALWRKRKSTRRASTFSQVVSVIGAPSARSRCNKSSPLRYREAPLCPLRKARSKSSANMTNYNSQDPSPSPLIKPLSRAPRHRSTLSTRLPPSPPLGPCEIPTQASCYVFA